ncbi:hypothetical protein DAT35_37225 [Vitiosangium sp. GDMCC 1.1324]|nr:hypothetical protein DAT35_37225 [Vitiosangium sp. GDMCC 1.1324]
MAALPAPAAKPPTPPPAAQAAPSTPEASALERLAQAVASDVREVKPEPPVALFLSGGAPELRRAFGTLLASRLASAGLAPVVLEAPSPEAAEARAREQGARTLARITLGVEAGELRAHGDVFGTWVNFWSGRAATRAPSPAAAIARSVEADAAALALAAVEPPRTPAPPEEPRPLRLLGAVLTRLPAPPAALAAGDLDGDGKDEVAVLTERSVLVFAADGRLVAERSLEVLPPSPAPTREPFGSLAILSGPPRIAAFSTRFAHGEVLSLEGGSLRGVSRLEAPILGPEARGAFVPGQTAFAPEVRLGNGEQRLAGVPTRFTTFSAANSRVLLVHPEGSATFFPRPSAAPLQLSGLGAGSALGDLDGDGTPELITTSPELQPSPDVLRVFKTNGGDPTIHEPLWQGPLPSGRALQVVTANLDGDKRREVVVGLTLPDGTGVLFLLRQGAP